MLDQGAYHENPTVKLLSRPDCAFDRLFCRGLSHGSQASGASNVSLLFLHFSKTSIIARPIKKTPTFGACHKHLPREGSWAFMLNFRLEISYPKAGIAGVSARLAVRFGDHPLCPIILTCDAEHTQNWQVPSLDQASIQHNYL